MGYPSEEGKLESFNSSFFNAVCVDCGSAKNIRLHPHRNGHCDLIGIMFLCDKCSDNADNITVAIKGIRASQPVVENDAPVRAVGRCGICEHTALPCIGTHAGRILT